MKHGYRSPLRVGSYAAAGLRGVGSVLEVPEDGAGNLLGGEGAEVERGLGGGMA